MAWKLFHTIMFLFGIFFNTFVYEFMQSDNLRFTLCAVLITRDVKILQIHNLIWLFDFKVMMRFKFRFKNVFSTAGSATVRLWVSCANNSHFYFMRCTWTHRDIPVGIQNNVTFKTWMHHDVPLCVWRSADSFIKRLSVQIVSVKSLTESPTLHLISAVTHLLVTVTTVDSVEWILS